MAFNPLAIFSILSSFPGNLVYYLILVYAISSCLLSIWTAFRVNDLPFPAISLAGLALMLISSLVPLIYLVIASIFLPSTTIIYPLLERVSLTILVIGSAWLWLGPNPSRLANITSAGLTILIPVILVLPTLLIPENTEFFNASLADLCWHIAIIASILWFTYIIFRSKPSIWPYGIGMMALLLVGFTLSLITIAPEGDVSGAARLGVLCAFPFLPLLARRYDVPETLETVPGTFEHAMNQAAIHAIPDEINAWLSAVSNLDLTRQQEAIARMLCQSLEAQGCAFLQLTEKTGIMRITAGYDTVHQTWIEPRDISAEDFPKTMKSVANNELTIIRNTSENMMELARFSDRLKLSNITSTALLPLKNENTQFGVAAIFRTEPAPSFLMESLQQFTKTAAALAHIFKNNETAIRERQDLIKLSAELDSLQKTNQTLQSNLESLRLASVQVIPEPGTLKMLTLQQASESEIDRLRSENRLLLQTLADETRAHTTAPQIDQTKTAEDLALARAEIARLQNLLQDSRARLKEIQKQHTISSSSVDGLRRFNNLITELRHPLSTITGYVDLMLSGEHAPQEPGSSQISNENLRQSLSRLRMIMNDMAELNVLNSGVIDLEPEVMDLGNAIDQAVATISAGYMEKEISLKLDLPPVLPFIFTYHEALKKVILYLLQNAGKVTPRGGSVILRVDVHQESSEPYLLIEVTDHGGGIAPDDLSKVFLTPEQRQPGIIPGLGETNGGLAASRKLVEAHGGRMWVDSDPGISSTFSVLLPIQSGKKK